MNDVSFPQHRESGFQALQSNERLAAGQDERPHATDLADRLVDLTPRKLVAVGVPEESAP